MNSARTTTLLLAIGLVGRLAAAEEPASPRANATLAREVRAAEGAFASSMALRDLDAFAAMVAEDALFLNGDQALRGRQAVVDGWRRFFEGPDAPFSWQPEQVEVLDSGTLAISSGPVRDPKGQRVGTFNSVWRLDPDGKWRVVIDKGCPPCECGAPASP